RGLIFLRNFINERKYFGLPVVPSAEGLSAAIASGGTGSGSVGTHTGVGIKWLQSAGSILPITLTLPGHTGRALVSARPFQPHNFPNDVACVTEPAIEFTIAGVAVLV
ncbi:MAG: hypothetical protein L0191_17800, partial [Acidobacteria bacterium]|nr:hypothetical protein [Acidobacteriota bacterium]